MSLNNNYNIPPKGGLGVAHNTDLMRPKTDATAIDVSSSDHSFTAPNYPNCLLIGNGGDIKVDTSAGSTVTISDVPDGYELKLVVTKIYSSGTTASSITAFHD